MHPYDPLEVQKIQNFKEKLKNWPKHGPISSKQLVKLLSKLFHSSASWVHELGFLEVW